MNGSAKYTAGMLAALALLSGAAKADDNSAANAECHKVQGTWHCRIHENGKWWQASGFQARAEGPFTPCDACPDGYELLMKFPNGGYSGGVPKSVCAKDVIDAQ